jgi:hypothetical protein
MRSEGFRRLFVMGCLLSLIVVGAYTEIFSQGRGKGNGRQQLQSDRNSRQQQDWSDRESRRQQIESDRRSRQQQARSDRGSRRQQIESDWRSRQQQARSDRKVIRDAGFWEGFPREHQRADRRNDRRNYRYDKRSQRWQNADQRARWNRPGPGTPVWANRNYQRPAINHYIRGQRKAQKADKKDFRRYQREIRKLERARERTFKRQWHRTPVFISGPAYRTSIFSSRYQNKDRYYRAYQPVYTKNYAYDPYYYRIDRAASPGYYIDHDAGDYYYDPYDQYYGGDPYYGYDDHYTDSYGYYDQMDWKQILIRNVLGMFLGGPSAGHRLPFDQGGYLTSSTGMNGWGDPVGYGYDTSYNQEGPDHLDLIGLFLQQIL